MPKIVDHDERRREILEATWRVIASHGIGAATVRAIAKEAGYSNGVLSHYFPNKEEILISAHRLAFQRVRERAAEKSTALHGIAALREALYEALPFDEERFVEAVMDVSFWSQAMQNTRLNAVRRESVINSRSWWIGMLAEGRERDEIVSDLSDEVLCDEILALVDGISVQAVLYPEDMTPARQRTLADAFLSRVAR